VLIRAFDGSAAEIEGPDVGMRFIWDIVACGDGFLTMTRSGRRIATRSTLLKMQLTGNSLAVKAGVLGIGRGGGTRLRVGQDAGSLRGKARLPASLLIPGTGDYGRAGRV